MRKKQSFIKGAIILSVAAIIVKIIGAIFKMPLVNILGGSGMGYFSTAYDLYMPIYVLSSAGFPVAISRVIAESTAEGRFRDVKKTLSVANLIFLITGTLGFCLLFFGADILVKSIGNPGARLAVVAMAPTIFFVCLTSAYRGYYQGLQNMYPTALSQVTEQIVKLVSGLFLATYVYSHGIKAITTTQKLFIFSCATETEALRLAAAAAILGVGIGSLFSLISIYIYHKAVGDKIPEAELKTEQTDSRRRTILKKIIWVAVPITLGSCVSQLTGIIDLWSVLNRLNHAVSLNANAIFDMYKNTGISSIDLKEIPNFLNGSYKGLAVTMYNLIPTFAVAFGVSALPIVTSAYTLKNQVELERNISSVLRVTMLLVLPAGISMSVLSQPILSLLFSSRVSEVQIAAPLLSILGIAVIFASACSPINSMLQAVGRADLPVKILAVCAGIKLAINYILVGIPEINIRGAAIGTLVCYAIIMSVSVYFLLKVASVRLDFVSVFLKPSLCALLCAATAYGANLLLCSYINSKIALIIAIIIGGSVYLASLLLTRAISQEDVMLVTKNEKILRFFKTKSQ